MSSKIATIKSLKTARDSLLNSATDKALTKSAFQSLLNKAPSGQINITSNLAHFNLDSVDTQTATITIVKTGDVESVSHSITLKGTTKTVSNNTASFTITGDDFKEDSIQIKVVAGNREAFLTLTSEKIEKHLNLYSDNPHIPLNSDGSSKVDSVNIQAGGYLGLRPVRLAQMLSDTFETTSNWTTASTTVTMSNGIATHTPDADTAGHIRITLSDEIKKDRTYYLSVHIDSSTVSSGNMRLYLRNGSTNGALHSIIYGQLSPWIGKRYSILAIPTEDCTTAQFAFGAYYVDATVKYSEPIIVDITDLISASPKLQAMTDAELQTWCDTYIPAIGANSTWTIGGKATNLLPNPTSSDGWEARSAVTGFSASNGIVTGSMSKAMNSYDDSWLRKSLGNNPFVIGDSIYIHFGDISGTNFAFGLSYWRFASNANSGIRSVERANDFDKYITVGANLSQSATVTIDTTKGINVLNLTSSGWLAQLSLMGIEGNENVKAWIDDNIPFFAGEMDFPKNKNLSYTWSNDRGLPIVSGDTQTIKASQLGLKPVTLTNLLEESYAENVSITNTWASTATWDGFYKSGVSSSKTLLGGHIYYCKIDFDYVSSTLSTLGLYACYPLYLANASRRRDFSAIYAGESKTIGNITKPTTDSSSQYNYYFYFTEGFAGQTVNLKINRSIYDITDLVSASPKLQAMTDVDLQAWCDNYIPIIEANSTWTVGGKAKNLELLYWVSYTTPVEGQPGVYKNTSTPTAVNSPYARFALSSSDKEGHMLCARVATKRIDGDASFKARVPDGNGWNYSGWGRLEKSFSTEWESYTGGGAIYSGGESQGWIHVYPFYESSTFPTVSTTFHNRIDNVFNLTSSGWLAQLSLMGIEGNANVKAWIDENVPFFEGETTFPGYSHITYTASCEGLTDTITIGTKIL